MRVICAWCRRPITNVGSDSPSEPTTHGICPDCKSTFALQEGVSLQEYIDNLPYPVVVIDEDMQVLLGNTTASQILDLTSRAVAGQSFGEIFECLHSRLPEGCGQTACCSGCAIRHAVKHTFQTGEAQVQVPATLKENESKASLLVTTRSAGAIVILRIDRLQQS